MELIIGIDPGTRITGYGIILFNEKQFHYIQSGIIKPYIKYSFWNRLKIISKKLNYIIKYYNPKILVLENIFIAKNCLTAIRLGETIGWILSNIKQQNIYEYSNLEIKNMLNIVKSNKKKINIHIKNFFKDNYILSFDATDALSVAITHCYFSALYFKNRIILDFGIIIWELLIIMIIIVISKKNNFCFIF